MTVGRCKDFSHPSKFGFTGSAGSVPVKPHMRSAPKGMAKGGKADMAQDKKLVAKAVRQHDEQLHGGKKTVLKLQYGGRTPGRPRKIDLPPTFGREPVVGKK